MTATRLLHKRVEIVFNRLIVPESSPASGARPAQADAFYAAFLSEEICMGSAESKEDFQPFGIDKLR